MTTNYIVFHDQESLDWFMGHNPELYKEFKYICVGSHSHDTLISGYDITIYYAQDFPYNIEQHKSLLAFTAWYLLANNEICKTDYVGIFEYDVIFEWYPEPELKKDTIYGFLKRELPDRNGLYLDAIPELTKKLHKYPIEIAEIKPYWNATTNFIMPIKFLRFFTEWYWEHVINDNLFADKKVSHYHERMINFYAAMIGYKNISLDGLIHKELNSHRRRI